MLSLASIATVGPSHAEGVIRGDDVKPGEMCGLKLEPSEITPNVVDQFDDNGMTPLMNLVTCYFLKGNRSEELLAAIRHVLNLGANPNLLSGQKRHSKSAFQMSIDRFYVEELVALLSEFGASPNLPTSKGFTPLLYAMSFSENALLLDLISMGVDLNMPLYSDGVTALERAINSQRNDKYEKARILLSNGAGPNIKTGSYSPLEIAVKRKDKPMLELLLRNGANPNYGAPLVFASKHGYPPDYAEMLLAAGADVNQQEAINLNTALHLALHNRNHSVATLLIRSGADLNVLNKVGRSPLDVSRFDEGEMSNIIKATRSHIESLH